MKRVFLKKEEQENLETDFWLIEVRNDLMTLIWFIYQY